jgi:hypothetical protein
VTEDLTNKVVAWATEIAAYAAQLPSRQARDDYLRERRRELVAGTQAEGATPHDAAIVADACVDVAHYDRAVSGARGYTTRARLAGARFHRFPFRLKVS